MDGIPPGYHLVQLADGSWALVNDQTGNVAITDPFSGAITGEGGPASDLPTMGANPAASSNVSTGGTQPFDMSALKWLGALVLLWIILAAMNEYSPNTAMFAKAFAGLILLGALYYLGPGAISNIPNLWKAPGMAGPNPVPGA